MDFSKEKSLGFLRGAAQSLFDENERLRAENLALRTQLGVARVAIEENAVLADLIARQQQALYGRSSERRKRPPAAKGERASQTGHGPREQPELEHVTINHEKAPEDRVCTCCGGELEAMVGQVETSELVSVTDRAFVLETHVQQKYRCSCNGAIVTADGPQRLIAGGRYSWTFAIEVAIAKYADHLPLTRQAQIMRRDGLRIDSQTLWDQLELLADYMQATYDAICKAILTAPMIHADETRWPLMANGKTVENKLFYAWGLVSPDLVAYRILDSRSNEAGTQVLGGYQGIVMADGYTVYQSLAGQPGGFVVANCWAHVRRKFIECERNFPGQAAIAIGLIKDLYAVEREATDETRAQLRAERSRPLVDKIVAWARELLPKTMPRSGLGEALGYLINQEPGLRRYLDDARVPIDNNACERALRGVVLGRKNHYGSRSRRGTEVAAIMYTLMECAKLVGVSPRAYLRALVERVMQSPNAVLMPGSFKNMIAATPT